MNVNLVCSDAVVHCSIRTVENCSDLCRSLLSDVCCCTATIHVPSLDHDSVSLTLSLLEQLVAGEQLVVESSLLGPVRSVLELLGVTWETDGDGNNNSSINPTTGDLKVLSSKCTCTCTCTCKYTCTCTCRKLQCLQARIQTMTRYPRSVFFMIFVQPPLPGLLPMWPVNAFLPAPKKASQKEKVQGYFHVIFCRQYFYKVTEMLFFCI